jgi:DNA-3-methyladenine glycosylase
MIAICQKMKKLSTTFYMSDQVLELARHLLGKVLHTCIEERHTAARIVETEAYAGICDRASHAYNGRRTLRNEMMYAKGGTAYVYLCYGIHHLFNIVTNHQDIPHAILIRAAEPILGTREMAIRRNMPATAFNLTKGPGALSQALGITTAYNGTVLSGNKIWLADDGLKIPDQEISVSPRIGVESAGPDALLPYRFFVTNSRFVSATKNGHALSVHAH